MHLCIGKITRRVLPSTPVTEYFSHSKIQSRSITGHWSSAGAPMSPCTKWKSSPYQVKGVAYLVQVKSKGWPTWSISSQRGGLPGPYQVKGVAYLVHIKSKGWPTWSKSSQRGGLPGPYQVKGVAYLVHIKLKGWPTWSTSSQRGGLPGLRPPADCAGPASCLAAAAANSSSVPTASTGSPATACWWPHHLHSHQHHALTITYTQALKLQKREGESWGQRAVGGGGGGAERERTMMMMSMVIAHDCTDLNAQHTKGKINKSKNKQECQLNW